MATAMSAARLRTVNVLAGTLHLVQMIAVLALSNGFSLPITATYMSGPPGSTFSEPVTLFNTPVGLSVAIFLGLSALAHFIVASPQFFGRYNCTYLRLRNFLYHYSFLQIIRHCPIFAIQKSWRME